ncbi:TIGR03619 family F420-dependent LLM class oxidoreductase [Streptomyces sp. NPDC058701]|uniref:TIGR03619 family F420-dependent LLM class oxidoreductase n=1 Tax=Streptomyces sp. NPDC058701 TaxID=3346608 RepID=UPI0036532101
MRISVTIFMTDETITPVHLGRELEQRGFQGLFLPEHTHIPISRKSPAPLGGALHRKYMRTLNPFVALSQVAAVTSRLEVGTGVTLVAQHDPIDLAKQVASLDFLSNGRFTLGVGFGWNREEAEDHGIEWSSRRALVQDRMALMRALWAAQPRVYDGKFGHVSASYAHPKPTKGAPRTLLGGEAGPRFFSRVAEYADGWLALDKGDLESWIPHLRSSWREAGRTGAPEIVPYSILPSKERMAQYRGMGIDEVVLRLPAERAPGVLRTLEDYAAFL